MFFQNLHIGLKSAASRGLISMFMTLIRKSQGSRLGKQDEMGYNLIHYAAMYNRHQIVALLILQSIDVNVRRNTNLLSTGRWLKSFLMLNKPIILTAHLLLLVSVTFVN